jgi:3-hydroxybutyryl-CoA dehydrogenase
VTDLGVQSAAANAVIEFASAPEATVETRERARNLGEALGKTPVEVPETPEFVVDQVRR